MRLKFLFILIFPTLLFAEDLDDMFGDDSELVTEVTEEDMTQNMENIFLTQDETFIGGGISFSIKGAITTEPDLKEKSTPSLSSDLFLDARPEEDFRGFIKGTITVPFSGESTDAQFDIKEIFTDFNYNDMLYFRGGKYKINWGVGRYFSPADVLNITEIDINDPDAPRVGPVSLKTNMPLGLNNLNLYLVAPNGYKSVSDTVVATDYSFILGDSEVSIGAVMFEPTKLNGVLTLSTALNGVNIYSELVTLFDEELDFQGVVGASYWLSSEEVATSLNLNGEYYYNGVTNQHNLITAFALNNILDTGVGLSATNRNEFSKSTGSIRGNITYKLLDLFSLSAGVDYNYIDNTPIVANFSVGLGGGDF